MKQYESCGIAHTYNIDETIVCQFNLEDILQYDSAMREKGLSVSHRIQILEKIKYVIIEYHSVSNKLNNNNIKYLIGYERSIDKLTSALSNGFTDRFTELNSIFGIEFLKVNTDTSDLYFISDVADIEILLANNIMIGDKICQIGAKMN